MRAEIISVGTELLLGDILNTNAQFLSQELAGLGYTVYYQTVVGDNTMRLRTLVQEAKERSELLIFTGGLGPTDDDLTKQTVADAFGDTLYLDDDELARMEQFFIRNSLKMTDNNIKQAMVPRNGRKLPNDNGTAPGAFFRQGDRFAFLLPGPPSEMKPMFLEQVRPVLEAMQDSAIRSLVLRTFGIGEGSLEELTKTLLSGTNPTAALYAKTGEVHIRITAKANTAAQADEMCFEYSDMFHTVLGDLIYSSNGDNLETTVVELLMENEETIATAESCTGGLLSERLTSVQGSSAVFGFGTCTYANEFKREILGVKNRTLNKHGSVSSHVAAEMAYGAAKKAKADYGIGITGVAGPEGGTDEKPAGLVYVAACSGRIVYVKKIMATGRGRDYVRQLATLHSLDMVRRLTDGLPLPGAKRFTKTEEPDFDRVTRPRRRGDVLARSILSFLAIVITLAAIFLGIYFIRGLLTKTEPANSLTSLGYKYGTSEYGAAAINLVSTAKLENPVVAGYIALPGGNLEQLVLRSTSAQSGLETDKQAPDTAGRTIIATDADLSLFSSNTLIVGGTSFTSLAGYQTLEGAGEISSFTYYTERDAYVYRVVSVYLLDEADRPSFSANISQLENYSDFLNFSVSLKSRSLYDMPVDLAENDRFMTITIPVPSQAGRSIYVCGRLLRAGEQLPSSPEKPRPNGTIHMPAEWYSSSEGGTKPNPAILYSQQLRSFLAAGMSNSSLQLAAGMPLIDAGPYFIPEPPPEINVSSSAASTSIPEYETSSSESASSASSSSEESSSSEDGTSASSAVDASSVSEAGSPASSSAAASKPATRPALPPQRLNTDLLTVTMNGEVITDSPSSILAQICQAEASSAHPEMIKAQAVAAHSWILNQQGAGIAAPVVAGREPSATVAQAVSEVAETILVTGKEIPAFTPWFALAASGTNSSADVWGSYRMYLNPVPSPQDASRDDWTQFVTLSRQDIADLVLQNAGINLAELSSPELWFNEIQRNESGYVQNISFGEDAVSGLDFWNKVLVKQGKPLLNSPAFEAEFRGENFVFTVYGIGHGCGMSQTGAAALAKSGYSYKEILAHYYPGTTFAQWV